MERDDILWMCVNSDSSCSAVDMRGCDDWDSVNTGSCLDGLCIWQCVKNWVNFLNFLENVQVKIFNYIFLKIYTVLKIIVQ